MLYTLNLHNAVCQLYLNLKKSILSAVLNYFLYWKAVVFKIGSGIDKYNNRKKYHKTQHTHQNWNADQLWKINELYMTSCTRTISSRKYKRKYNFILSWDHTEKTYYR